MPKCKNCGSEIQDGDMFCGYCGTRVEAVTETPQPAPERQTQQPAQPQQAYTETPHPVQVQPVVLKKVTLKSPIGELKNVKVGFSWTTFFFGPLVCLFRKDWAFGVIWLLVYVFLGSSDFVSGFVGGFVNGYSEATGGFANSDAQMGLYPGAMFVYFVAIIIPELIFQTIMAFKYNKMYIKKLLAKGWQPYGPDDAYTLKQKGIWNK